MDSLYFLGLRASQYLSLLLCAVAAGVFLVRLARQQKNIGLAGSVLACLVPFVRLMLPNSPASVALTFLLLAAAAVCIALDPAAPRLALVWLAFDAAVCITLVVLSQNGLWHSPYFLYAGLSMPLYLAIPYAHLARPVTPTQNKEV